jgi:uncharacterized protein (TIGR00251 family)
MAELKIREIEDGVVFQAKIVPGSSKNSLCGLLNGMLKVKVAAPPEKGKANSCLLNFLARKLNVKKNTLSIISGPTNPVKEIHILRISARSLLEKLNLSREALH